MVVTQKDQGAPFLLGSQHTASAMRFEPVSLCFSLTQARYFFPAINAFAFLLMLGLRAVLPVGARRYGQAVVVAALVVLTIIIYTQYVIPYWYLDS